MRNKKTIGIVVGAAVIVAAIIAGIIVFMTTRATPQKELEAFAALLQEQRYEEMYDHLSEDARAAWSQEEFLTRNQNIYSGIGAADIEFSDVRAETTDTGANVSYHQKMETSAGMVEFDNTAVVVREADGYRIDWDSTFIFPQLSDADSVSVQTSQGARGAILDRNGTPLAQDGLVYQVGLEAGATDAGSNAALASALDIEEAAVESAMSASWVQDGMFVPVKTLSAADYRAASAQLDAVQGISVQQTSGRVYPYAETCAHLTGYVQTASAEDLEAHADEGYTQESLIGKSGLEAAYESDLRAKDGVRIIVRNASGQEKAVIAETAAQDGKDIVTTIDLSAQQALYDDMGENEGAAVAMNAQTGEVLALVSTPSYDPNDFANGMDNAQWEALSNDTRNPMLSRYQSAYCPGSTFKAITAAIGLESGTITADTVFEKTERWQKDSSWGSNYVTTTHLYDEPSNLANALRYSDNIFFAQLADQIGAQTLADGLDAIGFNSTLPFELTLTQSSYGERLNDAQTLAATGYGQGDLLINPVHMTALYTAYVNEGSILQPYLIYADGERKIYKEDAYSADTAQTLLEDLRQTMSSYGDNPTNAAGKTGSAEVDNGAEVIGWTCAVNEQAALTVMMENTKEEGSSLYVQPIAAQMLEAISE